MSNARSLAGYAPNILSGTYTPSLTNSTNISSSTANPCQYLRVGNTVVVSGNVVLSFTASNTASALGISLPIASNLGQIYHLAGTGSSGNGNYHGSIQGDATNDRATLQITPNALTGTIFFQFTYQVI